ncbi:MAG: Rrf2 family transcriptional regulator [Rickettsiaceae bacterium]|nr:Rrf2 family transcriptional regulator [Rickettsiaceae bacterium]
MMLTTKGRYAVMALVDIALHSSNKPCRLAEVAERQNIDLRYLEQIFVKLKNLNVIIAIRGPNGGYRLQKSPEEIKISDIIGAVEESVEMTRCKGEDAGCIKKGAKCLTHDLWEGLEVAIKSFLENITIEDVLTKKLNRA